MPVEAWFSHKVQILWLYETVKILFCLYEFDNHAETETLSDYLFVQLIADGQSVQETCMKMITIYYYKSIWWH